MSASLHINLRHLEDGDVRLEGELAVGELGLGALDELIHVPGPLRYAVEVQKVDEGGLLVQGDLKLALDCECARCLGAYRQELYLEGWACHIPLEGEEKAEVINDCVDLTPYFREDIVLAFPQHPLCRPDCGGLANAQKKSERSPGPATKPDATSSAWAALDRLKL